MSRSREKDRVRSIHRRPADRACDDAPGGGADPGGREIDPAVGVVLHRKVGDPVKEGEPLCTIHDNGHGGIVSYVMIRDAFEIDVEPVTPPELIVNVFNAGIRDVVDRDQLYNRAGESAEAIRAVVGEVPRIAVVLGSGLGRWPRVWTTGGVCLIRKSRIPRSRASKDIRATSWSARWRARVLYLQGRSHFYEGHDLATVTFPVRVLKRLGVGVLILTAATGGINAGVPGR